MEILLRCCPLKPATLKAKAGRHLWLQRRKKRSISETGCFFYEERKRRVQEQAMPEGGTFCISLSSVLLVGKSSAVPAQSASAFLRQKRPSSATERMCSVTNVLGALSYCRRSRDIGLFAGTSVPCFPAQTGGLA